MHREKRSRSGAALVLLAASLAVATVASWRASVAAGAPAAQSGLSVVAPARIASGDVVRVVVPEGFASVSGRLCNTDPAIPDDSGACSAAVPGTRTADGRVEFAVPVLLGRIGTSELAYCPPAPSLNSPGSACVIELQTRDGPVVAAEVSAAAAEGAAGSQTITVVVQRESTVTTVGSTVPVSSTPTSYVPPTTDLSGPTVVTMGGTPGNRGPSPPGGALATTGPARVVSLAALAIALLDLGWLLLGATRSRDTALVVAYGP